MTSDFSGFNLSTVFDTVAKTVPDNDVMIWRGRHFTYGAMNERINRLANHLVAQGLGIHKERSELAGHESGQDHIGLYLRNGNEYIEGMTAGYRARAASFNVNYRYVEEELVYLLSDSKAKALIFHADFAPRVEAIRDQLPDLQVLIQVADESGNALIDGAVDYEETLAAASPDTPPTEPSPDDLYILYTGGTTGMPKGVLWRHDDIYITAMGGRPFGGTDPMTSYDQIVEGVINGGGGIRILMIPPFMHGAAQWGTFHAVTNGGTIILPDVVDRMDAADALRAASEHKAVSIPVVGDAIARPLIEELEKNEYDLSSLGAITNGGAPMTPGLKDRLLAALPHILLMDAVGSSETGIQMNHMSTAGEKATTGSFSPSADTVVLDAELTRQLEPGDKEMGWLAQKGYVPLGYLGDADKTARTFPVINGVRYSVPGDRAELLDSGEFVLLGRDSVTINTGGEKVFAEEVERAIAEHPDVYDVIVVGRPSERWGSEVVAVVQPAEGATLSDEALLEECAKHISRYKFPKDFVYREQLVRSPAGKADYRWAREQAEK